MKYSHLKLKVMFLLLLLSISACNSGSSSFVEDNENQETTDASDAENDESQPEGTDGLDIENLATHEESSDYIWEASNTTQITLNGSDISVDGTGATVDGTTLTISSAGQYSITGTLIDGQIRIDSEDSGVVKVELNGAAISNATSAPFFVSNAEKTVIFLTKDTENYMTDASEYIYEDAEEDEPNAAIFSKDDLTIYGEGSLVISANYNDGIKSKDGLIINSGNINVTAVDDGILGKDYLVINDGIVSVNAQGDGLKSSNDEDAEKGYILISGGAFNLTSVNDAIQAETNLFVSGGEFILSSGGGSNSDISDDTSAKGIKAGVDITITGGVFTINSADDTIHSNSNIIINGGTFSLATGDDGIHADGTVEINGGEIDITQSVEGIEGVVIVINDGNIRLASSDDGVNAAGNDDSNHYLYINGGRVVVDAEGDGIDVNGTIEMSGGVVIVHGPTANNNGAIDYDTSFKITGGVLIAAGSSRMAQAPGNSSTQNTVSIDLNGTLAANTLIHLETTSGEDVVTFAPIKNYQSLVFSSPDLVQNTTYDIYYGGSSTGVETSGLYEGGSYTPGTAYGNFTVSGVVTNVR